MVMHAHGCLCFLPKLCGPRQRKPQDDRPVGKPSASDLLYLPGEHSPPPPPLTQLAPGEDSPVSWDVGVGRAWELFRQAVVFEAGSNILRLLRIPPCQPHPYFPGRVPAPHPQREGPRSCVCVVGGEVCTLPALLCKQPVCSLCSLRCSPCVLGTSFSTASSTCSASPRDLQVGDEGPG